MTGTISPSCHSMQARYYFLSDLTRHSNVTTTIEHLILMIYCLRNLVWNTKSKSLS